MNKSLLKFVALVLSITMILSIPINTANAASKTKSQDMVVSYEEETVPIPTVPETPEPSQSPEPSPTTEPSDEPSPTEEPEPSQSPEPSPSPEPTADSTPQPTPLDTSGSSMTSDEGFFTDEEFLLYTPLAIDRDQYIVTTDNGDGTKTTSLHSSPVRFKDTDGKWINIDNSIVQDGSTEYAYKNKSSDINVQFSDSLYQTDAIKISYQGYDIGFKPINLIKENGKAAANMRFISAGETGIKDDAYNQERKYGMVSYEKTFNSETDIQIRPTPGGIKEEIILREIPSEKEFSYEITSNKAVPKLRRDGNVYFVDEKNKLLTGNIAAPYMVDSSDEERESYDIKVKLEKVSEGKYIYTLIPSRDFLEDPKTVYPVVIDPSYNYKIDYCSDTFVTSRYPNSNYAGDDHIKIGNSDALEISRGIVRIYDLGTYIGQNRSILSASFKAYQDYDGDSSPSIGIYNVTTPSEDINLGTVTWNNKPSIASSASATLTVSSTGWKTWNITSLVDAWYAYDMAPATFSLIRDHSFYIRNVDEGPNRYKRFRSENYSETYAPVVSITYAEAPGVTVSPTIWTKGNITVNWSGISNDMGFEVQYATNSTTAVPPLQNFVTITGKNNLVSGNASLPLPEGQRYVFIRALYENGIAGPASDPCLYKRDVTYPAEPTTLRTDPVATSSYANDSTPTIFWGGITDTLSGLSGGSSKAQYKVDNDIWKDIPIINGIVSGSYTLPTALTSGTHTIKVRGVDYAGNYNDIITKSVTYKLDTARPTVSISASVADGALNNGDPSVISGDTATISYIYSATDSLSQIKNTVIQVSINGANYQTVGSSPLTNQKDNSTYTFRIQATDNANNTSDWVYAGPYNTLDRRPPRKPFPVTVTPGVWTNNTNPQYHYDNATDYENHLYGVEYKIVDQNNQIVLDWPTNTSASNCISSTVASGSFNINYASYPDGEYTLYLRCRDTEGNTSNEEAAQVYKKDTAGVSLTLTSPVQDEILAPIVDIGGVFEDSRLSFWRLEYDEEENPDGFQTITSGNNNVPTESIFYAWSTYALQENVWYTLRLYAEDTTGNVSTVTRRVQKGVNPPIIDPGLQIDTPHLFADAADQSYTYQKANNGGTDGITGQIYIDGELKDIETSPGEGFTVDMIPYTEGSSHKFFIVAKDQSSNKLYSCKTQDVVLFSDLLNNSSNIETFSNTEIDNGMIALTSNNGIYSSDGYFITNAISTSTESFELKIDSDETISVETSIDYQYSVDGTTWIDLPSSGVMLNNISSIKIKGILNTSDTSYTPFLNSISCTGKYFIQQDSLIIALVDNPENLSTLSNVNHTIKLRWDASITPGATYSVYRADPSGVYTKIAEGITTKYWYDYNLNYEKRFDYKITAVASVQGGPRESVASNTQWAIVVDEEEIAKAIGKKPYWTFASFETGSGLGDVNVASGNLYYQTTDFSHSSPGISMNMVRSYNSHATYKTPLGYGWDFSFNISLLQEYDESYNEIGMILKMGDGTLYRFEKNTDGTYDQPEDSYIDLIKDEYSRYTVIFNGGTKYNFNQYMQLEKIEDRNNNAVHMEYDPNRGNLTRVYNNVGDEILLTYTYVSNELQEADRLDTVSDADVARRIYHYSFNNATHKLEGAYIYLDELNTDKYGEQYLYWSDDDTTRHGLLQTVNNPGGYGTDFDYLNERLITVADAKQEYLDLTYNSGETVKTYLNATARYQYDNTCRITKLTNALGHETIYTYDDGNSKNNIKTVSYLNKVGTQEDVNVVQSFTYDPVTGDKLTCTTPDGNIIYYTDETHPYNEFGMPTITKTPFRLNGSEVEYGVEYFEYDSHGNMTREAGPIPGNETLYPLHDQFGNVKTMITKIDGQEFSTVTYNYDAKGRLIETIYPLNTVVSQHYDAEGNIDWEEDAMSIRTKHTYDIIGRMKTTTRPGLDGILETSDDVTDKLDYDKNDNVVTLKEGTTAANPNGSVTTATYDSLGRLLTETDATNKEKSSSYSDQDANGNTIVTNKEGEKQSLKNTYDKAGRVSESVYGGITTTNTEYDNIGRALCTVNSAGGTVITEYDIMGRMVKTVQDPDGLNIINRWEYDLQGNITKMIDGKGIESVTVYDLAGRPLSESKTDTTVTPAKTITMTYDYDNVDLSEGTVKTVVTTHAADSKTTIVEMYDNKKGNLVKEVTKGIGYDNDTLESSIVYEYDKNNNNKKLTVRKSNDPTPYVTDFEYDKLDRLFKTTYAPDYYIEYTYDSRDNMLSMTQTKGTEITVNGWEYDAADRMLEVKLNGQTVVGYEYTEEGYLKYIKYPQPGGGERKVEYKYDDKLRLFEIADSTGTVSLKMREYLYDEDTGLLEKLHDYRKFGIATPDFTEYTEQSFGYDEIGRMSGVCYADIEEVDDDEIRTVKEQYALLFDNNSNITIETTDTYYGDHVRIEKDYTYDGFNRLKVEDAYTLIESEEPVETEETTTYEYDDLCNRKQMVNETGTYDYKYDQFNQLQEIKLNNVVDTTYTYDSRGNQLTRTKGMTVTTYEYDIADRMTATKQQIGQNPETILAQYTYDGSGQRLTQVAGADTTKYYYDGTDLFYTENGSGQRLEENIIEPEGSIFATKRFTGTYAGSHYFYRQDIRGSFTNIISSDAAVVKSYSYDAYGNTTQSGNQDFINNVAYTGAVYDESTGLYYMNARYYDSVTGRFVSADTYRGEPNNPWGWNEYGYCDGNPVIQADKSGHFFNFLAGLVGAAIGAVVGAAVTLVSDVLDDGQINTPAKEYLSSAASGAVSGLAAGVTCGASAIATVAVIGTTSFAGNVVGQGISKGFNKIDYKEALFSSATDMLSFGAARAFGPAVKSFGKKIVSKVANTAKSGLNKVSSKITSKISKLASRSNVDIADGVCFVAGTLIATGNGYKPIEEIRAGDYVWSEDPYTKEKGLKKVVQTFINDKDTLIKLFIDGTTIETTETHPFWVAGKGWVEAGDLKAGNILQQSSGEKLSIDYIDRVSLDETIQVYNFEVEDFHTYFVSDKSILVHNSCGGPKSLGRTGKQARLKELVKDDKLSKSLRGNIKRDLNEIKLGKRSNVRVPEGYNLAHRVGKEAKKGFSYKYSDLNLISNHKIQHKFMGY